MLMFLIFLLSYLIILLKVMFDDNLFGELNRRLEI